MFGNTMISPARKQIFVSCEDGSLELFKPEELQSHIYVACIQCGFDDSWLSEDLALSVEYLLVQEGKKSEFSREEIFLFTSRLLEETGYSNIALRFRRNCGLKMDKESDIGFDALNSCLTISRQFGSDSMQIKNLSVLVLSALRRLGINNPSDELILALAKHYTKNTDVLKMISPESTQKGILLATRDEITERLVLNVKGLDQWIAYGVFVFHPVSVLFPSLKISFSLAKFAEMKALVPPLTELNIMPYFEEIAFLVEESKRILLNFLLESGVKGEFPVILRLTDSVEFAKEYMGSESGDDKFIREFFVSLKDFASAELIIK